MDHERVFTLCMCMWDSGKNRKREDLHTKNSIVFHHGEEVLPWTSCHEDTRTDFYNFLKVRMLNEVNKWKKVEQMWEWVAHKNSWRLETRKDWLSKFNKKKRMRSRSPPAVPPAKSPNTVTIPLTHLLINGTRAAVRVYPRALAARTVKKRLLKAHVIIWIPRCLGGKELSMGTNHGINESWM